MPALPFKLNQDRRHHIPEQKRKVTNWREYDESLRRRGSVTVWFSDEAVEAWEAERRTSRGGQPEYSDLAILTALTFDRFDGRSYALRAALQDIADAEGNVDAYIALVPASARKQLGVAAEIGHRLLKAGRAQEALAALEPAAPKRHGSYLNDDLYYPGYEGPWPEWEQAYLAALDATGQRERARQIRWAAFEERLSVARLRAYLKLLPDFDDVLAEEKAMAYALAFPGFTSALHFFIEWPNLPHAARLILSRPGEIDGNYYSTLDLAAPI